MVKQVNSMEARETRPVDTGRFLDPDHAQRRQRAARRPVPIERIGKPQPHLDPGPATRTVLIA